MTTEERPPDLRPRPHRRYVRVRVIERVAAPREFFPYDLRLACGHTLTDVGGIRRRVVICPECTDYVNDLCFCDDPRYEHDDTDIHGCRACKRRGTDAETYRHVFDPASAT